jgi:two-component system, chemotaxis family, response regulator PixG
MLAHQFLKQSQLVEFLLRVSRTKSSGHLKLQAQGVTWVLHIVQGRAVYASDSLAAWDRTERLLQQLSSKEFTQIQPAAEFPAAFTGNILQDDPTYQVISWLLSHQYLSAEQSSTLIREWTESNTETGQDPTYQAIYWLSQEQLLNPLEISAIVEAVVREVLESVLMLPQVEYAWIEQNQLGELPIFCRLGLEPLLNRCLQRLKGWMLVRSQISSPYQRPYFFRQSNQQHRLPLELEQKLGSLLKGASLRHLAATLKQDELQLAQSLYPYITQGIIYLGAPQSPFDRLPNIPEQFDLVLSDNLMSFGKL